MGVKCRHNARLVPIISPFTRPTVYLFVKETRDNVKKMGRGRLRLCFLLSLVAAAASIPAPQEDARESAQEDINTEDMPNIFRDLFIPSREARELDEDGDEDVQDVSSDNEEEEDYKVMEATEAMDEAR